MLVYMHNELAISTPFKIVEKGERVFYIYIL